MKILLDTNAFIWWSDEPEKLSQNALALCRDEENVLFLSLASVREMQIKFQLGKLNLDEPLQPMVEKEMRRNNLQILPVQLHHVWALGNLPSHHKDPFDRMIIAQSQVEAMPILTADAKFAQVCTI